MADSKSSNASWHLLEFYVDDTDSCALTVYVNNARAHVIADSTSFKNDDAVSKEYRRLLKNLEKITKDATAKSQESSDNRADSGVSISDLDAVEQKRDDAEESIQKWMIAPVLEQHRSQLSSQNHSDKPSVQSWYHCKTHFFELEPDTAGHKLQAKELQETNELESRMNDLIPHMALPKYITDNTSKPFYNAKDLLVVTSSDQPPGTPYHPCRVELANPDPSNKNNQPNTLFLKIVDKNQLAPIKRELDILHRIETHNLHQQMRVPTIQGLVYFDNSETTPSGKKRIMGFLLTDIPSATPLTEKLDPKISQTQREKWAREADRMKTLLHEHGIIWGDAKADNFMVDENDDLWIIDFGGSYTQGWIDPAKAETLEGDDEGVERVVNALLDPVNNMEPESDGDESASASASAEGQKTVSMSEEGTTGKRKRGSDDSSDDEKDDVDEEDIEKENDGADDDENRARKVRRTGQNQTARRSSPEEHGQAHNAQTEDQDAKTNYCICGGAGDGDMVACDGEDCPNEWFHFTCVGLKTAPPAEEEWFCDKCRD